MEGQKTYSASDRWSQYQISWWSDVIYIFYYYKHTYTHTHILHIALHVLNLSCPPGLRRLDKDHAGDDRPDAGSSNDYDAVELLSGVVQLSYLVSPRPATNFCQLFTLPLASTSVFTSQKSCCCWWILDKVENWEKPLQLGEDIKDLATLTTVMSTFARMHKVD